MGTIISGMAHNLASGVSYPLGGFALLGSGIHSLRPVDIHGRGIDHPCVLGPGMGCSIDPFELGVGKTW